jgi:hypothetical protein
MKGIVNGDRKLPSKACPKAPKTTTAQYSSYENLCAGYPQTRQFYSLRKMLFGTLNGR